MRLRTRLAGAAVAAVALAFGASGLISLSLLRTRLVTSQRHETEMQSDLLRAVLEHEMMEGGQSLLSSLAEHLGREPSVQRVLVLDRRGRVRVSSDPRLQDHQFELQRPECALCHSRTAATRERSVTLPEQLPGGISRTVTPLANREPCHRCHDPRHSINGLLIVDRSLGGLDRLVARSGRDVLLTAVLGMAALLLTLGFALERLVIRRVARLRQFTRRFGAGDLAARAGDTGRDELGALAREFDTMAAHLEGAVGEVARERRQLDELVNGLDDGVLLLDRDLRVITINRALARRLEGAGATAGSLCFRAVLDRRVCGGDPSVCPAARALASGQLEKRIQRLGGGDGERCEEIYATPLHDAAGATVAVVEVWRDITDRKLLESELVHRERLAGLGLLASGVAHEVGNPLASIATAVEGLLRSLETPGAGPPEELREYLEIVQRQVFRCRDVTQRLLGFARRSSREVAAVDVTEVLREVVALCASQARAQGVRLESAVADGLVTTAEDQLLDQVFLNLVVNALQMMPGGGALRVEGGAAGAEIVVSFTDSGPGIPPEIRARLFRPFQSCRPDGHGTGLGLFLSHMLLESCGGTIEAQSGPRGGSVFTVRLPARHLAAARVATGAP